MCRGGFTRKAGREREGGRESDGEREGQGEAEREGSGTAVWLSVQARYSCGPETSSDISDQTSQI